jgi:uncharacterized protein DUF3551
MEPCMKKSIVVAALFAVALFATPRAAEAGGGGQPWCAHFPFGLNDCSFVTFQQCRAAISGNGGSCDRNLLYRGAPPPRERGYARWHWW